MVQIPPDKQPIEIPPILPSKATSTISPTLEVALEDIALSLNEMSVAIKEEPTKPAYINDDNFLDSNTQKILSTWKNDLYNKISPALDNFKNDQGVNNLITSLNGLTKTDFPDLSSFSSQLTECGYKINHTNIDTSKNIVPSDSWINTLENLKKSPSPYDIQPPLVDDKYVNSQINILKDKMNAISSAQANFRSSIEHFSVVENKTKEKLIASISDLKNTALNFQSTLGKSNYLDQGNTVSDILKDVTTQAETYKSALNTSFPFDYNFESFSADDSINRFDQLPYMPLKNSMSSLVVDNDYVNSQTKELKEKMVGLTTSLQKFNDAIENLSPLPIDDVNQSLNALKEAASKFQSNLDRSDFPNKENISTYLNLKDISTKVTAFSSAFKNEFPNAKPDDMRETLLDKFNSLTPALNEINNLVSSPVVNDDYIETQTKLIKEKTDVISKEIDDYKKYGPADLMFKENVKAYPNKIVDLLADLSKTVYNFQSNLNISDYPDKSMALKSSDIVAASENLSQLINGFNNIDTITIGYDADHDHPLASIDTPLQQLKNSVGNILVSTQDVQRTFDESKQQLMNDISSVPRSVMWRGPREIRSDHIITNTGPILSMLDGQFKNHLDTYETYLRNLPYVPSKNEPDLETTFKEINEKVQAYRTWASSNGTGENEFNDLKTALNKLPGKS